jgi:hypothetical protein
VVVVVNVAAEGDGDVEVDVAPSSVSPQDNRGHEGCAHKLPSPSKSTNNHHERDNVHADVRAPRRNPTLSRCDVEPPTTAAPACADGVEEAARRGPGGF